MHPDNYNNNWVQPLIHLSLFHNKGHTSIVAELFRKMNSSSWQWKPIRYITFACVSSHLVIMLGKFIVWTTVDWSCQLYWHLNEAFDLLSLFHIKGHPNCVNLIVQEIGIIFMVKETNIFVAPESHMVIMQGYLIWCWQRLTDPVNYCGNSMQPFILLSLFHNKGNIEQQLFRKMENATKTNIFCISISA